jgi:hypothetical protein
MDRVFELKSTLARARERLVYARLQLNRFTTDMQHGCAIDERKARKLQDDVDKAERDLEFAEERLDVAVRSVQALLP